MIRRSSSRLASTTTGAATVNVRGATSTSLMRRTLGATAAVVAPTAPSTIHQTQMRLVRQQIPPRPKVFVLCYISHEGDVMKDGMESDISIIRTRDLKFYLQRVMPDGEVIRWAAPGCEPMRHATTFESWSLWDIDQYGGILIPSDVAPTAWNEPPSVIDAVALMANLQTEKKLVRQTRRGWHRRVFSHVDEDPLKYQVNLMANSLVALTGIIVVGMRLAYCKKHEINFFSLGFNDVGERKTESIWDRAKRYSDDHHEQAVTDSVNFYISPGQQKYSRMRAETRDSDITDPHANSEFWWKMRHALYYGHWPKGLAE